MQLILTALQVQEAVADFVNASKLLTGVTVKPEHVTIKTKVEGEYDDQQMLFDGVAIDLAAAAVDHGTAATSKERCV